MERFRPVSSSSSFLPPVYLNPSVSLSFFTVLIITSISTFQGTVPPGVLTYAEIDIINIAKDKMKKRIKVYMDTSVISALFYHRNPERKHLIELFFNQLENFIVYISVITLAEVDRTPDEELKGKMESKLMGHTVLSLSEDINVLAEEYIKHKVIPKKHAEDAFHIAVAVANDIDYLLSWNFKHLVREKTRQAVNMVNLLNRLKKIEIITPAEIL